MTTKKTLSIDDDHAKLLNQTGINASQLLRAAIEHVEDQLTPKEKALLIEYNNPSKANMEGLEVNLE